MNRYYKKIIKNNIITIMVKNTAVKIVVEASKNSKCERCWQKRPEVGDDADHPGLCQRCIVNVDGNGEERYYA